MKQANFRGISGKAVGFIGVGAIILASCQTTQSVDKSDACYHYVQPIQEAQTVVQSSTISGAVVGAVLGGLLGLAAGGDGKSAGIGAAIGGGIGALVGNQYGKAESEQEKEKLLSELNQEAYSQSQSLIQATGTIAQLTSCRRQQVAAIEQRAASGALTKEAARTELSLVRQRVASDNRLIAQLVGGAQERVDEYVSIGTEHGLSKDVLIGESDYSTWRPTEQTVEAQTAQTYSVKTRARVRSGPGTNYNTLGSLEPGEEIVVAENSSNGEWKQFTYKGRDAFISGDLVELAGTEVVSQPPTTTWDMPPPENEVQLLAQGTAKAKVAQEEHQGLSMEIDQLFEALDA